MKQETKAPGNLRANSVPTEGYVLVVDGKLKTQYATSAEALTAGAQLKERFPSIQVTVFDAVARTYSALPVPEGA